MPFRRYFIILKNIDWLLFGAVVLLILFSLAALYSIAISSETPDLSNFNKQLTFTAIGLVLVLVIVFIDYHLWLYVSQLFYGLALLLLVGVLFFGQTVSGTTGWFTLPGLQFQPVEVAKLALIVVLAWFLSHRLNRVGSWPTFVTSGLFTGALFGLVLLQPDFGSGIILGLLWLVMVVAAGANKRHLVLLGLLLIVAGALAWTFFFQDYQRDRILTFLNPAADPYDRGYQVRQAIIAVGAGGLFGRGLGFGSQSQLKFIPASQTDFIFAVVAEELGFLGVGVILLLWAVIFYRLRKAVERMTDSFAVLTVIGISALFFIQLFINIGMNIGLLPVTGIPLPFLSYGGSFLLISLVGVGIIESMIARSRV